MHSPNNQNFRKKLWHEVEPIVIHGLVLLIIEGFLFIIGLATLSLEHTFPDHKDSFKLFKEIDLAFGLMLLCLFGICTLLRLAIRLVKGIKEEASEKVKEDVTEEI